MKVFRPLSWHEGISNGSTEYISHLLQEVGRLGMKVSDIERYDRAPHTKMVLSDLLAWLDGHSDAAMGQLLNWWHLDLARMIERVKADRKAKPRIEISATLTKMNNLSVCWHPGGWHESVMDWRRGGDHRNLIEGRRWPEPPDFSWFMGDEEPTFQGRATNELLYVRGVGSLDPKPREHYGAYATFNHDVVDSILLCAVRCAYERLVRQLEENFEVTVLDAFEFVTREERKENDSREPDWPIQRVVDWSLEDAAQLRARHERAEQEERERKERHELETIEPTYGCSMEAILDALVRACSARSRGSPVSQENINRDASKALRANGAKIDAGEMRRVRQLIERYRPEILPAVLQEQPSSAPEGGDRPVSNVVVLALARSDGSRAPRDRAARLAVEPKATHSAEPVDVAAVSTETRDTVEQDAQWAQELKRALESFGCTVEAVIEALTRAYSRQPPGIGRPDEHVHSEAARELRSQGARVDKEGMRRLRRLIELCKPEMLPEGLRPTTEQHSPGE
jgi:hypothetical protein